uniref:Uncharacterized protein n=1 Tax=Anguilla anguilla TaxID=7936 RepID=A0A0E9RQZ4_ANGAN
MLLYDYLSLFTVGALAHQTHRPSPCHR